MAKPSHLREDGTLTMVDVGAKPETERFARARASVRLGAAAERALREATVEKGDAYAAARLAGIMAAKKTSDLIPLAHPLPLGSVNVDFAWRGPGLLDVEASASTVARTGVEMEALCAASVAALALYDMLKAVERDIAIESVVLVEKRGGKSGPWRREE